MEKRGQFFVFGAIILCLAIFVLVTKVNTYEEKILLEDFPDLTENYKTESVKVVNDALLSGLDPTPELDDFTDQFVNYARTINPNIGFIYAYKDQDGIVHISNYGTDTIDASGDPLYPITANSLSEVNINLNGMSFKKTVPTKLSVYDKSYIASITDLQLVLINVGGVFYPLDLTGTNSFAVISRDSTPTGDIRVDLS